MSDYMDEIIFEEYERGVRLKKPPRFVITLPETDPNVAVYEEAFHLGRTVSVMSECWTGDALVVKIDKTASLYSDHLLRVEVTFQGTGAPRQATFHGPTCCCAECFHRLRKQATRILSGREMECARFDFIGRELAKAIEELKLPPKVDIKLTVEPVYGKSPAQTIHSYISAAEADAYVKGIHRTGEVTFPINYTSADYAERAKRDEQKRKEGRVKIRNRFYVAAPAVTTEREQAQDNVAGKVHLSVDSSDRSGKWTRKTLEGAVAHAQTMLEKNPTMEHVAISQIVRIVRRRKAPAVVEVVK